MTRGQYRLLPQAREDAFELYLHIAKDNSAAAERFAKAIEQTCDYLAALPNIGAVKSVQNPSFKGMRVMRVSGFRVYLMFYIPTKSGITVIRIIHGARDLPEIFS